MLCELDVAPLTDKVGRDIKKKTNATNSYDDVVTVQRLLQQAAARLGKRKIHPGKVDGKISKPPHSSSTVNAILEYQRNLGGFPPDGIIQPGLTTIVNLSIDAGYVASDELISSVSLTQDYLGRTIDWICGNGFHTKSANHCAHFVAHVFRIGGGYTCRARVKDLGINKMPRGFGANIRVHELFAKCPQVEEIIDPTPQQRKGLIFVSGASNFGAVKLSDEKIQRAAVHGKKMRNIPKKHVGVLLNGSVWHYSNTRDYVIKQTIREFVKHYPRQTNAIWFGSPPVGAFTSFSV